MIKWYKKRQYDKAYRRGFSWAMESYYIDKMPGEQIEAYIFNRNDPFDKGAALALRNIDNFQGPER